MLGNKNNPICKSKTMISGTVLPEQRNIKLYYFVRCSGEFFVFVDDFPPVLLSSSSLVL